MTAPLSVISSGLGTEVAVSEIDKELRLLWEQDQARTNASLINLVVYSEKPGALLENSAIVRDLTREHACRAILVGIDRANPEASLRAWITAHCHLAHGMKSVCCEQIAFRLTGVVTGRFRNTVFAHLNSDLPLLFWWQGELSSIFSERLVSVVDRLIVDSSEWKDPAAGFRRVEEASQSNKEIILQDLAWSRTWQIRLSIAGLFDDPAALDALPEMHSVDITYHPAHRNSALQLLAWLAVQAGWSDARELELEVPRQHAERESFGFESRTGLAIHAVLTADPESAPIGKWEMRSRDVRLSVSREATANHLLRELEAPGRVVTSHSPADPDLPANLVFQQLARGGKNSLFRKILPRFRTFLGVVEAQE
jgi:glucose-6-phosphate dehydrogenase assembly protein OpcA